LTLADVVLDVCEEVIAFVIEEDLDSPASQAAEKKAPQLSLRGCESTFSRVEETKGALLQA